MLNVDINLNIYLITNLIFYGKIFYIHFSFPSISFEENEFTQ